MTSGWGATRARDEKYGNKAQSGDLAKSTEHLQFEGMLCMKWTEWKKPTKINYLHRLKTKGGQHFGGKLTEGDLQKVFYEGKVQKGDLQKVFYEGKVQKGGY